MELGREKHVLGKQISSTFRMLQVDKYGEVGGVERLEMSYFAGMALKILSGIMLYDC